MSDRPSTPGDVLAYYAAGAEAERLAVGAGALELERTKELILRFLDPNATVADVGGATGLYSEWLAGRGHRVELIEPVPLHLEQARRRAGEPPRFGVHEGDARALPLSDSSMDAVLLLGPLYHLGERDDRVEAVREAARVCRPDALVFAAAISRFAPLLDTIRRGRITDGRVFANVQAETRTGRRVEPDRRNSPFPDAYFHLPEELQEELSAVGLSVEGIYGVEGPCGWQNELDWDDATVRERALWAARETESSPHLLAVSAHLLGVARKPTT